MVVPSPRREVTFAPLSMQGVPLWYSLFQKERSALSCKKSPVACKARVKQVKHVPLCTAMVMAWPLQGELRFPLATFHYHLLTTRLLGAKAKALIPTGSL